METNLKEIAIIPSDREYSEVWMHPGTLGVAINMKVNDLEYLIVNGEEQSRFNSVRDFVWSNDGLSYAYVGWDGHQDHLGINGTRVKTYEEIDSPTLLWSEQGLLAYVFQQDEEYFVAVGDKSVGPLQSRIPGTGRYHSPLCFRPHTNEIAYIGKRNDRYALEINGERMGDYEFAKDPMFSSSGASYAVIVEKGDNQCMVWDGNDSLEYRDIKEAIFSNDGTQLAYIGKSSEGMDLVINDVVITTSPYIKDLNFSTTKGFACVISDGSQQTCTFISGEMGPNYNNGVTNLAFSANGQHFAYVGHNREVVNDIPRELMMEVTINHQVIGAHKRIIWQSDDCLVVNNEGDKVAYLIYQDDLDQDGTGVGLNGEVDQFFDGVYGSHQIGTLHFDDENRVSFAAIRDNKIYWVTQQN